MVNRSPHEVIVEMHPQHDPSRFTMTTLAQLGFGRAAMEEQIVEEADELAKAMLRTEGQPCRPER